MRVYQRYWQQQERVLWQELLVRGRLYCQCQPHAVCDCDDLLGNHLQPQE